MPSTSIFITLTSCRLKESSEATALSPLSGRSRVAPRLVSLASYIAATPVASESPTLNAVQLDTLFAAMLACNLANDLGFASKEYTWVAGQKRAKNRECV